MASHIVRVKREHKRDREVINEGPLCVCEFAWNTRNKKEKKKQTQRNARYEDPWHPRGRCVVKDASEQRIQSQSNVWDRKNGIKIIKRIESQRLERYSRKEYLVPNSGTYFSRDSFFFFFVWFWKFVELVVGICCVLPRLRWEKTLEKMVRRFYFLCIFEPAYRQWRLRCVSAHTPALTLLKVAHTFGHAINVNANFPIVFEWLFFLKIVCAHASGMGRGWWSVDGHSASLSSRFQ